MMGWAVVGAASGAVMGLSGAGGAVVSVPLFLHLLGYDPHQATLASLYVVLVGAAINSWTQRSNASWKMAAAVAGVSWLGSAAFAGLKASIPAWGIRWLFAGVCLLSLSAVLRKRDSTSGSEAARPVGPIQVAAGGMGLGGLATLTGLGGGVLLMPWYATLLRMPMARASATSLVTIFLTALGSIAMQVARGGDELAHASPGWAAFLAMLATSWGAAIGVKRLLKGGETERTIRLRKAVYVVVILISLLGTLIVPHV